MCSGRAKARAADMERYASQMRQEAIMNMIFVDVLEDQFAVLEGDTNEQRFSYDLLREKNVVLFHRYFNGDETNEKKNLLALEAAIQFDVQPGWFSQEACRFLPNPAGQIGAGK